MWFNFNEFNQFSQKSLNKLLFVYFENSLVHLQNYETDQLGQGPTGQLLPIWSAFDALKHHFGPLKSYQSAYWLQTIWLSKMRRQKTSWGLEVIITNLKFRSLTSLKCYPNQLSVASNQLAITGSKYPPHGIKIQ